MDATNNWLATLAEQPWDLLWRLFAAAVLGGIVGLEREATNHSAGLRTNMLVALGSCLFTIISIYGFPESEGQLGRDPARLAAQIVSGIGFLGAGAVLHHKGGVRGLTTAASIWLVAAIGMAAGTGNYFLAVIATIVALVVLVILRPLSAMLSPIDNDPKREEEGGPQDDDGAPSVPRRRLPQ